MVGPFFLLRVGLWTYLLDFLRKRAIFLIALLVLLVIVSYYIYNLPSFRYRKEIATLNASLAHIESLTPQKVDEIYPGHQNVQDRGVHIAKNNIGEERLRPALKSFKEGNIEEGRRYLLEVAKIMDGWAFVGDPKEGLPLDPKIKNKYDPRDKYIKGASPSEVWREEVYIPIINVLVSTDKEYRK